MLATPKEPDNGAAMSFQMKLDQNTTLWWKDVFNSSHKHWGHISYAHDVAMSASYKYFAWNGRIYYVESGRDTGLLERDVL